LQALELPSKRFSLRNALVAIYGSHISFVSLSIIIVSLGFLVELQSGADGGAQCTLAAFILKSSLVWFG